MYRFIAVALMIVAAVWQADSRMAYVLPDAADTLVVDLKTTFSCDNRPYGYYADVDNDCKVFHVCQPIADADSKVKKVHAVASAMAIISRVSCLCNHSFHFLFCY